MSDFIALNDNVHVVACPLPFSTSQIIEIIPAGKSIAEALSALGIALGDLTYARVEVDGERINSNAWSEYQLKPGSRLTIRVLPTDGDGEKNPLRTVLTLAVMYYAGALGQAAGGGFLGGLVSATAAATGMMVVNQIAPPSVRDISRLSGDKQSQSMSISGARNRFVAYGVVQRVLGKVRLVPNYGATPYTEIMNNDQYLRLLFAWHGRTVNSEFKIGETPLESYQPEGLALNDINDRLEFVRHDDYQGERLSIYSNDVYEEAISATLRQVDGWFVRTTQPDIDEITIDIAFQRLMKVNQIGQRIPAGVTFDFQITERGLDNWRGGVALQSVQPAEYAMPPANGSKTDVLVKAIQMGGEWLINISQIMTPSEVDWFINNWWAGDNIARVRRVAGQPITDQDITDLRSTEITSLGANYFAPSATVPPSDSIFIASAEMTQPLGLTASTSGLIFLSRRFLVPRGQYDIRIKRVTPDSSEPNTFDDAVWHKLRSIRYANPVAMTGINVHEMRIKASDRLNNVVDEYNLISQTVGLDWDRLTQTWVERPIDNPASLYRFVLQDPSSKHSYTDDEIDLITLQQWHEFCDEMGFRFSLVIDFDVRRDDVLDMIAAAGRASRGWKDTKRSVVYDAPKTDLDIRQDFCPRNSWGFESVKTFYKIPHAFRVRFINEAIGGRQDEVLVYDDGYDENNAAFVEDLELIGIPTAELAWIHARYHLATLRLRSETYTWSADVESLVCNRGDLITRSDDVMLWGLGYGRVLTVGKNTDGNIISVSLDAEVPMLLEGSYVIRFRRNDQQSVVYPVVTQGGLQKILQFEQPIEPAIAPETGNTFAFGDAGKEVARLIIKEIEPQPDFTARITAVDESPGVHIAHLGPIPPFNSNITQPLDLRANIGVPNVISLVSDESVLLVQQDGSLKARIVISLGYVSGQSFDQIVETQVEYRIANSGGVWIRQSLANFVQSVSLDDVETAEVYDIRLRYRLYDGRVSDWTQLHNYTVVGDSTPPPAVNGIEITRLADGNHVIKVAYAAKPIDFSNLSLIVDGVVEQSDIGSFEFISKSHALKTTGTHAVGIIAIDRSGNASAEFTVEYIRPAVPVIDGFTIALQADGNHAIKLTYSNRPVDFKDFSLAVNGVIVQSGITSFDFVIDVQALKTPGTHAVGIIAIDRSGNASAEFTVEYIRPAVPVIDGFTIALQADGNHAIKLTYSNRPVDFKDFSLAVNGVIVQSGITSFDFVTGVQALKTPGAYSVGIIALDGSLNQSIAVTVNYTRPQVPDVPPPFIVSRQSDGTREFKWTYPTPSIDHAGFKIRYKIGLGPYALDDLLYFPGIDSLPPGTRLFETNQFAEGEYTFAITAIDTSGNESVNANFIIASLGSPRIASIAAQEIAEAMLWPGTLTNCFINEHNVLEDVGTQTWDSAPAQFDNWTSWNQSPHGIIIYEHTTVDAGGITDFVPLISASATGDVTIDFCYSDDNVTYSAWQTPAGQVRGRYVKARAIVVGSQPYLSSLRIMLSAELTEEFVDDLSTLALAAPYRVGSGQIHIPITNNYSKVKHVGIVFQGVGAGWNYKLIDKDHPNGPLVYLYDGGNALADALIDTRVVGIKSQ